MIFRPRAFYVLPSSNWTWSALGIEIRNCYVKNSRGKTVLEMLRDNREGLTSAEITIHVGYLARMRLLELREEGKVIQKKGYAKDGKVTYLYALT